MLMKTNLGIILLSISMCIIGYLLEYNNSYEFLIKIHELINNDSLRKEMGEFNLEKIKDFDRKKVNNLMEEIYSEL